MHVDVRVGKLMRTMSVDTDDAISDTWLCDRGRYNLGFVENGERITQPLYKQNGQWVQIGWDDALQLWATAINEAVAANPAAAGVIGGGRLTNEEAYMLQYLFRRKGVRNLDWRAGRQRQATPGRDGGKLLEIESVDAMIVIGESAAERAPVADLRVRKAAFQKKIKLIRVGSVEAAYPPPIPSVDVATVAEAVAELPEGAKTIAVLWDGIDLSLAKTLLDALPDGVQIRTYVTGEQPNARGAEAMGMLPHSGPGYAPVEAGLDTSAMLAAARDGQLAVLSILGANPALHYPDGAFVREALSKVPFVVVSELFMTETAQLATLVLPAKGPFEKTGTTTNMAGDVLPVNAARSLESPDGPLTDLEMIIGLAQLLGVDLPFAEELDTEVLRHAAASADAFTLGNEAYARVAANSSVTQSPSKGDSATDALRVALQTRIFAGGGTSAHDDRLPELRPLPEAAISAADAAQLGVQTCDYIDLEGDGKTMHDLLVEVRDGMPQGTVALIDGLPDDPGNLFGEGARVRVSNVRKAQPLVGQAHHDEVLAR
jgi:NADH-quinone oxidoreductase subunit G